MSENPCRECGACCAVFRVSFYWAEADDVTPGGVPVSMTEDIGNLLRAMKGTNTEKPPCAALEGAVGHHVFCSIYDNRPSTCRDVLPSYQNGKPDDKCDFARFSYNLEPLGK